MHLSARTTRETHTRRLLTGQNYFYFPEEVYISREGEDLIRRLVPSMRSENSRLIISGWITSMMNWSDKRLNVNQIKSHPFFYGADWNSLRHIEPPFVPHLQSITDTSYFPTDGLDNLPDQLEKVEGVGAEKDLAFLGYVL